MNEEPIYALAQDAPRIHEPAEPMRPLSDLVAYFRRYSGERPEVVALLCIGLGFVVGCKLKPW